jgi:hypothetical protein
VANSEGFNLFKGFNPEANGSGKWLADNNVAERLLGRELNTVPLNHDYESGRDKVFRDAAIDYIKSHPLRSFGVLPMYKVALFWIYDISEPKAHQLLYQLQFWPLFVLSIIALAMAARSGCFAGPDHRTVLVLFALQTPYALTSDTQGRSRMP